LILNDQPYLAADFVNHPEEPVVLLAHRDKYLVQEARRNVRIEIEEQPAIFTLEESLAKKAVIWGEDNVFKKFLVDKGNVDDAWASADLIIEGEGMPQQMLPLVAAEDVGQAGFFGRAWAGLMSLLHLA